MIYKWKSESPTLTQWTTIVCGDKGLLLFCAWSVIRTRKSVIDFVVGTVISCCWVLSCQSLDRWSCGVVTAINWGQALSTSCLVVNEIWTEASFKDCVTGQLWDGSYFLSSLLFSPSHTYIKQSSSSSSQCISGDEQQKPVPKANYAALLQMLWQRKEPHTGRWNCTEGFLEEGLMSKVNVERWAAGIQWRRWPLLQDLVVPEDRWSKWNTEHVSLHVSSRTARKWGSGVS